MSYHIDSFTDRKYLNIFYLFDKKVKTVSANQNISSFHVVNVGVTEH